VESITSSKLFTTRQGTVLLGVIAAVIAAIALIVYLNHYRNSVNQPPIQVLVATSLIQKGTSGDVLAKSTHLYKVADIPKNQVETGAITDTSTLAGKVALVDINPNSQLTESQFGDAAANSIEPQLSPTQRAVVVSLGSPQTVGGQISAGSHVDVWVTTSGQSASGANRPIARLLFQDMYILGVNGGNVTMRATPTQAGQIIYAAQNAPMWLVLRPTVAANLRKPPVISGVGG
jgi:Flp pilus assembly protein CpaB